jgi:DNA-repair protein complementing XP-A cells
VQTIEPKGNNNKPPIITNKSITLQQDDLPEINENFMKECEECHQDFLRSNLYRNFAVHICDDCRDPKGAHELITRTDAKAKYLLKDCDLDLRKPRLRYILKKNPYQSRGDMRLYLKYQIEERAIEVHGSEEKLEEELEKREERRTMKRQKVYDKKIKSLSMQVRSSLYKHKLDAHEHEFGEAICIDDESDIYQKTCKTCNYKWEYEEM